MLKWTPVVDLKLKKLEEKAPPVSVGINEFHAYFMSVYLHLAPHSIHHAFFFSFMDDVLAQCLRKRSTLAMPVILPGQADVPFHSVAWAY